ncbi:MAG TPA: radical SAM protein [bacterium]|nr:radical SAM protein [bacterium]
MKITLLTPPPLDGRKVADRVAGCAYGLYPIPNIFELTMASVLENGGHDVRYVNFPVDGVENEEAFSGFLDTDDSDLYAFYTVNLTRETDRTAARMIHARRAAHVVFYGPSPSYNPDEFIIDSSCHVVRGEPELSFAELASGLEKGTPAVAPAGVTMILNGEIVHGAERQLIEDLDSLPFPARKLIKRDRYNNPKLGLKPFTAVLGSRNCPFQCVYCVPCSLSFARELEHRRHHEGKKPPVRKRSPENVGEEFEMLAREGYRSAVFLDDQFIWDEEHTVEMCRRIAPTGIIWGCATRADFVTDTIVAEMKKAGCRFMDIGAESFDQRILDDVNKNLKVDTIRNAIGIIRKNGIDVKLNILVGCSALETKETIRANKRMIAKLKVDQVMYNIANPFPGTKLYEIAKRDGWFVEGDYRPSDVQKEAIIRLPNLEPDELVNEVRRANFAFFFKPGFVLKRVARFRSLSDFIDAFRALRKKLSRKV